MDIIDGGILLDRMKTWVGIKDTAFSWFYSYRLDITFSVTTGIYSSATAPTTCGVPQGSILGPILFSIYMLPFGQIIKHHIAVIPKVWASWWATKVLKWGHKRSFSILT